MTMGQKFGAGQMQTWFPAEEKGEYAVSPIKASASHCHYADRKASPAA